jgi:hypothetical protein
VAEQKARVSGIQDVFAMFGGKHQELQAACISDVECTVAMAKDKLLAELGKDTTRRIKITSPTFMRVTEISSATASVNP